VPEGRVGIATDLEAVLLEVHDDVLGNAGTGVDRAFHLAVLA